MRAGGSVFESLSGATRVIFIVGDPISQVQSPAGATEALRSRGAAAIVVPAHVAPTDLANWIAAAGSMRNCDAILVTVPHKFAVLPLCQDATPQARSIR